MLLNLFIQIFLFCTPAISEPNADQILGKWISEEKNLTVEISKSSNQYNAKILWFDDSDDKSRPLYERTDWKNPDALKRNRKVVGMQVLEGLYYNTIKNIWEKGRIYDASSGRQWDATIYMLGQNQLKVRGFWHFEFIGKDLIFSRVVN